MSAARALRGVCAGGKGGLELGVEASTITHEYHGYLWYHGYPWCTTITFGLVLTGTRVRRGRVSTRRKVGREWGVDTTGAGDQPAGDGCSGPEPRGAGVLLSAGNHQYVLREFCLTAKAGIWP